MTTRLARAVWRVILVAAVLVLATGEPGLAQEPTTGVPCEVAMVVGCVTTVDGEDGAVTLVLAVDEPPTTGSATSPATDGEGTADAMNTADADTTTGADGEDGAEGAVFGPVDEPPVRSGVDPWERGGLRSNFGTGSIPISHYQIGADVTGWLGVPDPLDSFVSSQTNWAFTTSTFLVILATNALDWAFEFPLAESLIGQAGVLAQSYTIEFFGFGVATSVYSLALSVTMVVAAFKAVTRGLVVAGGEVIPAFVAFVVLTVLTMTSGFGDAGLAVARTSTDLSAGIASFAVGVERQDECARAIETVPLAGQSASTDAIADPPPATGPVSSACSFGYALQRSLIELPYQNLQWGQTLDGVPGKERCAEINRELLAEGPWGNDDEPRNRMRSEPACEENADFNHQATYIRLGIASANTITTGIVTLLILVVAAMLLWQQVKLLVLTVTMPHALVLAILPGRSRELAWQWLEHLVGVIVRTVVLALGLVIWLSLFSLIVHEQLTARGVFVSLFASVAMAVSGFYALFRLLGLSRRGQGGEPRRESKRRRGGSDSEDPGPKPTRGGRRTRSSGRSRTSPPTGGGRPIGSGRRPPRLGERAGGIPDRPLVGSGQR